MKFQLLIFLKDGRIIEERFCGLELKELNGAGFEFNPNCRGWQNINPQDIERIQIQPRNHGDPFTNETPHDASHWKINPPKDPQLKEILEVGDHLTHAIRDLTQMIRARF